MTESETVETEWRIGRCVQNSERLRRIMERISFINATRRVRDAIERHLKAKAARETERAHRGRNNGI